MPVNEPLKYPRTVFQFWRSVLYPVYSAIISTLFFRMQEMLWPRFPAPVLLFISSAVLAFVLAWNLTLVVGSWSTSVNLAVFLISMSLVAVRVNWRTSYLMYSILPFVLSSAKAGYTIARLASSLLTNINDSVNNTHIMLEVRLFHASFLIPRLSIA